MENSETKTLISTPGAILLGSCIIAGSIFLSSGLSKSQTLGTSTTTTDNIVGQTSPSIVEVSVSVDDDPVLGSANAPVTLIEFSDYECPYCKRHFDQTYLQLKKDYIDTGKVKLVYRDFPLSFHDPLATKQAVAASCARDQGGDSMYFRYHDEIFKRTKSNGQGMPETELEKIATDIGLNIDNFRTCSAADKYVQEVKKDIEDGTKIGVGSTPSFFVGKSSGSAIKGTLIKGALPYANFKAAIDKLLK